jgi:hypothetical protein
MSFSKHLKSRGSAGFIRFLPVKDDGWCSLSDEAGEIGEFFAFCCFQAVPARLVEAEDIGELFESISFQAYRLASG